MTLEEISNLVSSNETADECGWPRGLQKARFSGIAPMVYML